MHGKNPDNLPILTGDGFLFKLNGKVYESCVRSFWFSVAKLGQGRRRMKKVEYE